MEEDVPIFPDPPAVTVERTLAIIKPDAIQYAESIIEEIKANGFTIVQVRLNFKLLSFLAFYWLSISPFGMMLAKEIAPHSRTSI